MKCEKKNNNIHYDLFLINVNNQKMEKKKNQSTRKYMNICVGKIK